MQPVFVTLEGIEGVGKSTAIQEIEAIFKQHQLPFIVSREPGGTLIGEKIRGLLLADLDEEMLPETECLLIFAARHQHLQNVVLPAFKAGKSVICDRFIDATYAYQGAGRGIDAAHIAYLQKWIHPNLQPDLTLLLDASVETALARANARGQADRIEAEGAQFFNKIRDCYLQRAKTYDYYQIIDANQPLDSVQSQLKATLNNWLDERNS